MQQQLFQRNLSWSFVVNRTWHASPMNVRASFPPMHNGGYKEIK
jgi:hypothetical protein